jgi:serine phosphatase RsbU (regulator of sigma subunit)
VEPLLDAERLAALRESGLLDSGPEEAFDRLTRLARKVLGVPVALVSLVDADRQYFKSAAGLQEPWATTRETPLSHSFCQHVVLREAPLVVTDAPADALVCDNGAITDLGVIAYAGIPLKTAEGHVLGSFCAIDSRPREWSDHDLGVLSDLAAIAQTEIELRRRARRQHVARRRSEIAAEASVVLSESLDYEETLQSISRLVVPGLADWCAIDLVDAGTTRRIVVSHADPAHAVAARGLEHYPPDVTRDGPIARVVKSGEPILVTELLDEQLVAGAEDPQHLEILRSLGLRSAIIAPLVARNHSLGALTMMTAASGRSYDDEDVALAMELARRAALAVDNARLHRAVQESGDHFAALANTLQQSLLPPDLPTISGITFAASYRPSEGSPAVGGDFYDVFQRGRDNWAVVMGDVRGKGAEAASLTALARYTLRAAAMQTRKPGRMLELLNEAIVRNDSSEEGAERFCTASLLTLRLGRDSLAVNVANGGHPLPLVLRADGTVEPAGAPGPLIGLFAGTRVRDTALRLLPGDGIVLYTDGVIEARSGDEEFGTERLVELLGRNGTAEPSELVAAIETAVLDFQDGHLRDDTAIVALRFVGVQAS